MRTLDKHLRLLAVSTLLAAAPLGFAHAQNTEEAAVERLGELVGDLGFRLNWSGVNYVGSTATLMGVTIGVEDESFPIGNVVLNDIAQVQTGYSVESIVFEDHEVEGENDFTFSISGVELGNVLLPNEGEQDIFGGFLFYETAEVGSLAVSVEGTEVFTLTDMHFESTNPQGGNPMDFTGSVENFTVSLSQVQDPNQRAVIQALGYEELEGYIEMAGRWQPADGRMTFSQYDIAVVDAGTLGLTFDFGGYTPELIASLRELQQQMAADPEGDNSAQGLAMLGLLQQLTFHSTQIRFEDDSLTNKVIEFVAQMQGTSAANIRNQAKAVLPFGLAQLNVPELTTAATQAASRFLDDPQSLTITAAPGEPVPFALIMAEAMSEPRGLVRTLGVTVTSND